MKTLIKDETHWHELRAKHIGSSEVAALFSLSPYSTRFELWHIKNGSVQDYFTGNKRTRYGQKLEAVIAECVAEETGWEVIEEPTANYYSNDRVNGMGATPDRLVRAADCEDLGVLEIKNVDRIQFNKDWKEEPPIYYQLQLQHQLACTGLKWGAIAVMVGGNDLRVYTFDSHDGTIGKIEDAVRAFWQSIKDQSPPPPVEANDYDVVRALFSTARDEVVDLSSDNELPMICAELCTIAPQRGDLEKREKSLKAQILAKVGSAARATCNGFFIAAPEIVKNMKAKPAHEQRYRTITVKELAA